MKNFRKLWILCSIMFFFSFFLTSFAFADNKLLKQCEEIKKIFPKLKVSEIHEGPLPKTCELWAGTNVVYYYPEKKLLFFGEIWTINGKSLTQEARSKIIASRTKSLDLSKAIKWGRGPVKVILFTDPDCPFCRKVEKLLFSPLLEQDITIYAFLYPLAIHPNAREHAEAILCSSEPINTLLSIASGAKIQVSSNCKEKVKERLENMIKIAKSLGISGTPFLIIEDEVVGGADLPRIFQTIARKKEEINN